MIYRLSLQILVAAYAVALGACGHAPPPPQEPVYITVTKEPPPPRLDASCKADDPARVVCAPGSAPDGSAIALDGARCIERRKARERALERLRASCRISINGNFAS
jgi:hypothetical protein